MVGGFHLNGGGSGASRTLSEVLGYSRNGLPFLTADDTPLALHVLHNIDIVIVVDVGGGSTCLLPNSGVKCSEFIQLGLRGGFTLCLGSQLALAGQDVNKLPSRICGERERTLVNSGGDSALSVLRKSRPSRNQTFADIVEPATKAGALGRSLAPSQGSLKNSTSVSWHKEKD